MDAMSRVLRKAARSPFLNEIEQAEMLDRFTRPPFNCYDGKTDSIEHVSHYIQMMSLHTHYTTGHLKDFVLDSGDKIVGTGYSAKGKPSPFPCRGD